MKDIKEYISENIFEGLKSGYWHGEDAWILDGNSKEGYTILIGGYNENEAKKIQKLVKDDKHLGKAEDYVLFVEPEDWEEQNS